MILFIDLGNAGGLVFVLPFLMFLFLLALGEDYNILVMTRIREEAGTLPLRMAVIRALGSKGTTVTSAGLVLAGTFAVFAVVGGSGSGGSEVRDVGFGLALGILMDTFLVRTLLVPSDRAAPRAVELVAQQTRYLDGGPRGPAGAGWSDHRADRGCPSTRRWVFELNAAYT